MLEEAKAARERVLADLVRRRGLLQAQVDELRNGRDHMLDAYRTVKRTFLEATEALSQVEARAAEGRPIPSVDPEDVDAIIAAERIVLVGTDPEHPAALAEVDTLFPRIRAGHGETVSVDADTADGEGATVPAAPDTANETVSTAGETSALDADEGSDAAVPFAEEVIDLRADALPADVLPPASSSAVDAWRTGRARTVDPLMSSLMKRAKRAAQDDQNALLDAVRRHKGRPNAAQVLANDDTVRAAWEVVLRDAVDAAYGAGRVAAGSDPSSAPDDVVADAVAVVVGPLRARLSVAIDSGEEGDSGGLVERIGARYREWKNQSLEAGLARRAGGRVDSWCLRRHARRRDAALDPARRGTVLGLRRQCARADGKRRCVPDGSIATAGPPGMPLPARPRDDSRRSPHQRVNRVGGRRNAGAVP